MVAAGTAILVLLPLALPIMLSLRLTGEGKVLFWQKRLGYRQSPFWMLKFATMLEDSPNMPGGILTLSNDPRITPMGGILRKSKINELPQLWNVLVGEMSIVGPRPLLKESFDLYSPEIQAVVYESRPGLTGVGSLVFRDEVALTEASREDPDRYYADVIYPYKGRLEYWYYENRSLWTDMKILLLTGLALFFPRVDFANKAFKDLPTMQRRSGLGTE